MKRPVQALEIPNDSEVMLGIMTGSKKISIREGLRDYIPGKLIIYHCEHNSFSIQVEITEVKHTTLNEVTDEAMKADGYQNKEEMFADLKGFYPSLTWESPMTVIYWDKVQGVWANEENVETFSRMIEEQDN